MTTPMLLDRHPDVRTLFYCIGAQKTATTWLAKTLAAHPDCHLSRPKELHYWGLVAGAEPAGRTLATLVRNRRRARRRTLLSALLLRRDRLRANRWKLQKIDSQIGTLRDPSLERYVARLTRGRRGEPVVGEATPTYATLGARTFREMAALHPDTRFLFVMRDPVERLWSGLRHTVRVDPRSQRGAEAQLRRAFVDALEDGGSVHLRRSDYRATIRALEEAVPAKRVHYLFYETMRRPEAMGRLGRFLGLAELRFDAGRRLNAGVGREMRPGDSALAHAREILAPVYDFVGERFAQDVPREWRLGAAAA